jgi:hypothetical protein
MAMEAPSRQATPGLLGLRPPADLAEAPVARAPVPPASRPKPAPQAAERPAYPVISSGWDSEDQESRGKTSDLMTAVKALAVLSLFIVAVALLIR